MYLGYEFGNSGTPINLFYNIYKANASLLRDLEEHFAALQLTLGRLCLLYALDRSGGKALPSQLGDELAVTRANISGLLNALEKINLVRREIDTRDRRHIVVIITDDGRRVLQDAWPIYDQVMCERFQHLDQDEREMLLRILQKI